MSLPSSAKRRNRPGEKREKLYDWRPINSLQDVVDAPYGICEFIQHRARDTSKSVDELVILPKEFDKSEKDSWIIEQFRQLLLELNGFVVFHQDVCTKENYPKMTIPAERMRKEGLPAKEDLEYLCAAFHPPREVSAMDYMVHTLQQAITSLTDPELFPNRHTLSKDAKKEIKEKARRLYRIFAFSYFVLPQKFSAYEVE